MITKSFFSLFAFLMLRGIIYGQTVLKNEKWGTIKIEKTGSKSVKSIKTNKKTKTRIASYSFRKNGYDYIITFPKSYTADLYPLVFNNAGLAITDCNKNLTSNKIQTFNYDLFIGNVFVTKKTKIDWFYFNEMLREMNSAGCYTWVTHLSYKDENGILHQDEIPEFKIQRVD